MQTDGFIMQGLLYVHQAMRRDAFRFARACAVAASADDVRGLQRWFERFRIQLDEHHHAEDELFFPLLRERDASLAADLAALDGDHRALVEHLTALTAAFGHHDWPALSLHARALAELLDGHVAAEEALVVPATIALMTVDDQRALETQLRKKAKLSEIAFALPWLLSTLSAEPAAELRRQLPFPLRALHDAFWKRSYARLAAPLAAGEAART